MMPLTIIIISHNSYETVVQYQQQLIDSDAYRILIVDNASIDGSAALLATKFKNCEVIALDTNVGYGRATNVALDKIDTPYALLLNPDIIMSPEQIDLLIEKAKIHPQAAIFAPATHEKHMQLGGQTVDRKVVSGSCMLFDMQKLKQICFFDKNIFLFSEEADLCMRVRQAGYKVIMFSDIDVKHIAGTSSGASNVIEYLKNWHYGWSRSYYHHKHGLDSGKKSLTRRLWLYRWKALTARGNYRKVKFKGICAGITAFNRGEKAFLADGLPQANPTSQKNPYSQIK